VGLPGTVTPEIRIRWDHTYSRGGQALTTDLSSWEGVSGWITRLGLSRSIDDAGRLRRLDWRAGGVGGYNLLWEAASLTVSGATNLELQGNGVATVFERDVLDQVTSMAVVDVGSGVTAGIETWDPTTHAAIAGGLGGLQTAISGAQPADSRYFATLTRNAWGGVAEVVDPGWDPLTSTRPTRAAAFTYDGAGRLTAARVAEHVFRYGHDALNNLTHRELVSAPGGSAMPKMLSGAHVHGTGGLGPRQLASVLTPGGTHGFNWDAAGRLVTLTPPTGPPGTGLVASRLVYDAFDRLRLVTDDDGVATATTAHAYGSDGQRMATRRPDGQAELRPARPSRFALRRHAPEMVVALDGAARLHGFVDRSRSGGHEGGALYREEKVTEHSGPNSRHSTSGE